MKCCGNAVAKIGSFDSSYLIIEYAKSHRDAIKMIRTCSEIFKIVVLVQLFGSMSLACFFLFYVQNVRIFYDNWASFVIKSSLLSVDGY
jgi:hypothetical protein